MNGLLPLWALGALQLALALVFALSAWPKVKAQGEFANRVAEYQLVPGALSPIIAMMVTASEVFIALALLLGLFTKVAIAIAVVLLLVFSSAISVTLKRKRRILCGCFADDEEVSVGTLFRLGLLLLVAFLLGAAAVQDSVPISGLMVLWLGDPASRIQLLFQIATAVGLLLCFEWLWTLREFRSVLFTSPARAHRDQLQREGPLILK